MILRRHSYLNWRLRLLSGLALAVLLPTHASAASLCVEVERNGALWRSLRAALGGEFLLSFQHSVYGSRVEEAFRLRSDGFQLIELRYSERRLVEFYGYESADYRNAMWVVKPKPALISSLHLSASSDAHLSIFFDGRGAPVRLAMPGDSAFHLRPAACKDARDG